MEYLHPHSITLTSNYFKKIFINLRRHYLLGLTSLLFGIGIYSSYRAFHNPLSPTVLAINSIFNEQPNKSNSLLIAQDLNSAPSVLAVSVVSSDTPISSSSSKYTYVAQNGDSAIKISQNAIGDYLKGNNISTSEAKINYAAYLLHRSLQNTKLSPKDEVSFDEHQIQTVLDQTENKFNTN